MTTTLVVASSKGGVGKSTIAVHHAAGLALRGHRVLLIDLDPTASATDVLVGRQPTETAGAADAILGRGTPRPLEAEAYPGLAVLPATQRLAEVDVALASQLGSDQAVARIVQQVQGKADYVVVDTPPVLGRRTLAALVAADAVIVPVACAYWAIEGLVRVEEQLAEVHRLGLAKPRLLGYVLFDVDARQSAAADTREILRARSPGMLYRAEVRTSAAAKTISGHRQTSWDDGADARGRDDHAALLSETLARIKKGSRS